MKQNSKLLDLITKLEVTEFIGLAKLLKVKLVEEKDPDAAESSERYAARDFSEVLNDILMNFELQTRARRREILSLLKAATKKGDQS